ncbi:MAG: hypothetical protein WCV89_03620 [Candidatus Paceibacterota bacterium]|jgi:hypothetical protein
MQILHNMTVEVLPVREAWERGLKHIPARGIFLKPGDVAVTTADGYPVIISTANEEMLVAHAERVDVVDAVVEVFKKMGIPPFNIEMCFQLHAPEMSGPFMDQAIQAGLRKVWTVAVCPIAEFLAHADAAVGGQNFIALRRDN